MCFKKNLEKKKKKKVVRSHNAVFQSVIVRHVKKSAIATRKPLSVALVTKSGMKTLPNEGRQRKKAAEMYW